MSPNILEILLYALLGVIISIISLKINTNFNGFLEEWGVGSGGYKAILAIFSHILGPSGVIDYFLSIRWAIN